MSCAPCPFPAGTTLKGRYVTLAPLGAQHFDALALQALADPGSFRYMRHGPFADREAATRYLESLSTRMFEPAWAVQPESSNAASGWLSLTDIAPDDAALEIGSIWFAPSLRRTRAATEAVHLLMGEAFDALGYQRMAWRNLAANVASGAAAARFGFVFEGVWRQAAALKHRRHDVEWRSLLSGEWPARRAAVEAWLQLDNFDENGVQRRALRDFSPQSSAGRA